MILTDHTNLWRAGFLAHIHMLMETLGIIPPARSVKSFPRAERENRPCCLTSGGENQHRRFHLQGRLKFGSDTVKELKCLLLLMLLDVRSEPYLGPGFMTTHMSSG